MSDIGRYRRSYPRIWRHPGFTQLSRDEQRLVLYLLHGPQSNRIGLFHFSVSTAAEDLNTTPETLKKGLANVTVTFGWCFDADARVFYIPSWWRSNPPENRRVIQGSLKDLNEVPPCSLVEAFALNVEWLSTTPATDGHTVRQTFVECLGQRLPKRTPTQDQEQISNRKTGKQEPTALRASATLRGLEKQVNLLPIARQVVKLTNGSIEHLCDAFRNYHRDPSLPKTEIVEALNVALSKKRAIA